MSEIDVSEMLPLMSKGQFVCACPQNTDFGRTSFSELRFLPTKQQSKVSKTYSRDAHLYILISAEQYYQESCSMGSDKSKTFQNTQLELVVDTNDTPQELLCTEDMCGVDEIQDLEAENAPNVTMELVAQGSEESTLSTTALQLEITAPAFPTSISAEPLSGAAQTYLTASTHEICSSQSIPAAAYAPQSLETVPDDILLCIFQQLDVPMRELKCMKRVCKRWSALIVKWEPILKVGRNVFVTCEELDMMLLNEIKHSQKIVSKIWENRGQLDITPEMRAILVDWLVEVCEEFQLHTDTLFLCVGCIDRYLSVKPITRDQFQLLGITSLLVAAKYEELYVPTVTELAYITDNTYTKEQVMSMEGYVLNSLGFSISFLTSNQFTHLMLQKVIQDLCLEDAEKVQTLTHMCSFFVELTLLDCQFLRFFPSLVGTAVVALSAQCSGLPDQMSFLQAATNYKRHEIKQCADYIIRLSKALANETTPLAAIRNKFSQPKFGGVAKIPLPFDQLPVF